MLHPPDRSPGLPVVSDSMRRLLEERWPRVRDEAHVQLAWLRTAVATNIDDVAGSGSDARKVAHQLRGRFGMYGHRAASEVAGAIEDRLVSTNTAPGESLAEELNALIDQLDALLARKPAAQPVGTAEKVGRPAMTVNAR